MSPQFSSVLKSVALCACVLLKLCTADDILGCGGFLRSSVDIEYSKVQVRLYTKQGSLKYQTDCAPNNGYYFMPVYDKGDYIIKIDPPDGWSFTPREVELSIDGTTDACSLGQDVDFSFQGFGVTGQVVSLGSRDGPEGVTVTLTPLTAGESTQVITGPGGKFTFSPVPAGDYQVQASHAVWRMGRDKTRVTVKGDNGDVGTQLTVAGFDLSGQVFSGAEPVAGVTFVLHGSAAADWSKYCDVTPAAGYAPPRADLAPAVCWVKSDQSGRFVFPVVPAGEYTVVPFYAGARTRFDVRPADVSVAVVQDSALIAAPFQVAGFTISGRVVAPSGAGVGGATVSLDGRQVAVTTEDGAYVVESAQAGQFRLTVNSERIQFESRSVAITPVSPELPDVVAASFQVCGQVDLTNLPDGVAAGPRSVEFKLAGSETAYTAVTKPTGHFCTFLRPATYRLRVVVSERDRQRGLSFGSAQQELVVSAPVSGVGFSPFRALVAGRVTCLAGCGDLSVTLTSADGAPARRAAVTEAGRFEFRDVLPGQYAVSAAQADWCWKSGSVPVTVSTGDVTNIQLTQSGYQITVTSTHATALLYSLTAGPSKSDPKRVEVTAGVNQICVSQAGVYILTPQGCHGFMEKEYRFDTNSHVPVELIAVTHEISGAVATAEPSSDVKMKLLLDGATRDVAVMTSGDKKTHSFSVMAKPDQSLEFVPGSATLLFTPMSRQLTATAQCQPDAVHFHARKGAFISGRVSPALASVDVTVSAAGMENVKTTTDTNGKYQVGPLDPDRSYAVSAEREGYVLTPSDRRATDFDARKLAELKVKVTDEQGRPLPGVLVSVSGGTNYRKNSLTDDTGSYAFLSLSPGQYFVRPMMKEYEFVPAAQMAQVEQGATLQVTISGRRVAYSLLGRVASLAGEPEAGVVVEAVATAACHHHQEEATSEADGALRIRGLKPKCAYEVRLKSEPGVNAAFARGIPKSQTVQVESADVTDFRLVAFRRIDESDVTVRVLAAPEHLSSLRLVVSAEHSDTPLHSLPLHGSPMVVLPTPLPRDGRVYAVRLETTLSGATYQYRLPEVALVADAPAKHLEVAFAAERRGGDTELGAGPVLGLPLTVLAVLVAINQRRCADALRYLRERYMSRSAGPATPSRRETGAAAGDGAAAVMVRPVTVKVKSRKI